MGGIERPRDSSPAPWHGPQYCHAHYCTCVRAHIAVVDGPSHTRLVRTVILSVYKAVGTACWLTESYGTWARAFWLRERVKWRNLTLCQIDCLASHSQKAAADSSYTHYMVKL